MVKSISFLSLIILLCVTTFAQTLNGKQKECTISAGLGIAGPTQNAKSSGASTWLQLDYKLIQNISIATDFCFLPYKQPGYYKDLPISPNEVNVVNNNFSLLLKYHFLTKSKVKVSIGSGWTYCIRQNDYYYFESNSTMQNAFKNITTYSDFVIPFIAEVKYPISNKVNLLLNMRYYFNYQNGDTYSSGVGLMLRL